MFHKFLQIAGLATFIFIALYTLLLLAALLPDLVGLVVYAAILYVVFWWLRRVFPRFLP